MSASYGSSMRCSSRLIRASVLVRDGREEARGRGRDWRDVAASQGTSGATTCWRRRGPEAPDDPGRDAALPVPRFPASSLQDLREYTSVVSSHPADEAVDGSLDLDSGRRALLGAGAGNPRGPSFPHSLPASCRLGPSPGGRTLARAPEGRSEWCWVPRGFSGLTTGPQACIGDRKAGWVAGSVQRKACASRMGDNVNSSGQHAPRTCHLGRPRWDPARVGSNASPQKEFAASQRRPSTPAAGAGGRGPRSAGDWPDFRRL